LSYTRSQRQRAGGPHSFRRCRVLLVRGAPRLRAASREVEQRSVDIEQTRSSLRGGPRTRHRNCQPGSSSSVTCASSSAVQPIPDPSYPTPQGKRPCDRSTTSSRRRHVTPGDRAAPIIRTDPNMYPAKTLCATGVPISTPNRAGPARRRWSRSPIAETAHRERADFHREFAHRL